jgi:hypothetical protein
MGAGFGDASRSLVVGPSTVNLIPSSASWASASFGNIISPLAQLLNENRPARGTCIGYSLFTNGGIGQSSVSEMARNSSASCS